MRLARLQVFSHIASGANSVMYWHYHSIIVVPVLYSAPNELLNKLNSYVKNGGNLVVTFKSAFTNEYVKVSYNDQPNIII